MKKFLKRLLLAGSAAAIGYQSFRAYRVFRILQKIEKELPDYMESNYGEKPKCDVSLMVNITLQAHVKLVFSPEYLQEHPEQDEAIRQYLLENYPILKKCAFRLFIVDSNMSKVDILKKYHPKAYKMFGKMVEQKLKEKEQAEVQEEPTD